MEKDSKSTKKIRHPKLENISEYFLILAMITVGVWTAFKGQIGAGFQMRLILVGGFSSSVALISSISAGVFTVEIPVESD